MERDEIIEKLLIVVIIILVIIVVGSVMENNKKVDEIKQVVSVSNKIVENVKFMELEVGDDASGDASYKTAVAVFDESKLNVIEDMINTGEKYEFKNPSGFDHLPIAKLYKEDGEIIQISAIDDYSEEDEEGNYILYKTNKSDIKRVYKVKDRIGSFIENLYDERYDGELMLYYGSEASLKTGVQYVDNMPLNDEMLDRYLVKYNQYEKNKKLKAITADSYQETYEGYFVVEDLGKIAITEDYNPLPRQSKKLKNVPDKIKDSLSKFDKIEMEEIDLDGDQQLEYIVAASKTDDSVDGKIISKILLYNKDYKLIDTLAVWDASEERVYSADLVLSLNAVMYFDINNDDKMEILVELPSYEGSLLGIYRYDENVLYGETNYQATMRP